MFQRVGVAVVRDDKLLMVRKTGTSYWAIPGGRLEAGETALAALRREVREELAVELNDDGLALVGEYKDRAAESGEEFQLTLYSGEVRGEPTPSAEISEYMWFDGNLRDGELPPMFVNHVRPALQRSLRWQEGIRDQ